MPIAASRPLHRINADQPLNRRHPLMRGAVLRWKAFQPRIGGGTFWDIAGHASGVITAPRWDGTGLILENTDIGTTEATATIPALTTSAGFTVSLLFRAAGNAYFSPTLLDFPGTDFTNCQLNTTDPGGGNTTVTFKSQFNNLNGTVANGVVSHIAFTQTGSNIALYVNGVLAASDSFGGTGTTGTSIILGRKSGATAYAKGMVNDLILFNRVLSASEILSLSRLTRSPYDPTLNYRRRGVGVSAATTSGLLLRRRRMAA